MIASAKDLGAEAHRRTEHYMSCHGLITELVNARNGIMPARYEALFHEGIPRFDLNQLRMAHDDLTGMAAKVFPVNVRPRNNSDKAKAEAMLVENVCLSYNDAAFYAGGLDHMMLKQKLAWWLLIGGDAVAVVLPDYERKSPYFHFRDPRTHLPPVGWGPWSPVSLNETLFSYELSLDELRMRFPERVRELNNSYDRSRQNPGFHREGDGDRMIEVVEYYSRDSWMFATCDPGITLARSDDGDKMHPGVCPVVPFTMYDGVNPKGRPPLADEVGIQAAISRFLSQTLEEGDAIINPIIAHTEVEGGELRRGPGASNQYVTTPGAPPPRIDKIAPDNPIHALNTINFLAQWGRVLTRNPESMQGMGEADSAKAVNALRAGVEGTIKDLIWPLFFHGEPRMYQLAMEMDINVWGNTKKEVVGRNSGSPFRESYRPNVALKGYEHALRIKQSHSAGGYQGEIQRMQKYGAGLMPLDAVLEEDPAVEEPLRYRRALQTDQLEKIQYELFTAQAQSGALAPDAIPKIIALMNDKDISWMEAAQQLSESGELLAPPPEAAPEAPGGGGGMEELMAALGGGQDPMAQGATAPEELPNLGQLRAIPA